MSYSILNIMERAGMVGQEKLAVAWVNEGLDEIAELSDEHVAISKIDVVANTRLYDLPSNLHRILGVYRRYDDDGRYVRIGMIQNLDLIEDWSSTEVGGDEDIIII